MAALWAVLKWRKHQALVRQQAPAAESPAAPSPSDTVRLAEQSGAFDFCREEGENVSSTHDSEPL